jgi:ethanolamine utilization protein EutN
MQLGLVLGTATATIKHSSLEGRTILIVQPRRIDGEPDGDPLLAVDTVGAGHGETVMITSDGRSARSYLGVDATPVRWTTIGIKDE